MQRGGEAVVISLGVTGAVHHWAALRIICLSSGPRPWRGTLEAPDRIAPDRTANEPVIVSSRETSPGSWAVLTVLGGSEFDRSGASWKPYRLRS